MGIFIASQTAINSRLSIHDHLPLLTSAISFAVGSLFLALLTISSKQPLFFSPIIITTNPWWIWLGGLTAAFALTVNILLFKHLGSMGATLYPIIGQIIMSLLIDQFGWFDSLQQVMNWQKVSGAGLLILGLLIFINILGVKREEGKPSHLKHQFIWQVLGISGGVALAVQNAVNAKLGKALSSPLHAAFISFFISFVVLVLVNLILKVRPLTVVKQIVTHQSTSEWWIWFGGILGSSYVALSSVLVPVLGTGQVVILALFGQLVFSALIQQFGWFTSPVYRINRPQVIGTLIMFSGILLIKFS